jgi:hypothetical protein
MLGLSKHLITYWNLSTHEILRGACPEQNEILRCTQNDGLTTFYEAIFIDLGNARLLVKRKGGHFFYYLRGGG